MPHRHPLAPIVAVDIDGTIGQYHEHFTEFARLWTGRDITMDWRPEYKGKFSKALGMSQATYRDCKLAFRQGGMKRSMPVFEHAPEMLRSIRKAGAQVWICTTRPYLRLDNVDPDTRHFLRRNKLQFDGVLYGERKYRDLVHIVGKDRVVCVLDDLPEQITAADRMGVPTILKTHPSNDWFYTLRPQAWAADLHDAEQMILKMIKEHGA